MAMEVRRKRPGGTDCHRDRGFIPISMLACLPSTCLTVQLMRTPCQWPSASRHSPMPQTACHSRICLHKIIIAMSIAAAPELHDILDDDHSPIFPADRTRCRPSTDRTAQRNSIRRRGLQRGCTARPTCPNIRQNALGVLAWCVLAPLSQARSSLSQFWFVLCTVNNSSAVSGLHSRHIGGGSVPAQLS
jgi:hypothetical protein